MKRHLLSSLLLLGFFTVFMVYGMGAVKGGDTLKFDPVTWQSGKDVEELGQIRAAMLSSLLSDHIKIGMARQQVVALLGEPAETVYFKMSDLVYWVGPEQSLFSVDNQWLTIDLDEDGMVQAIEVKTD